MDISKIGAFLDWGLEKELFLPFKEQSMKLEKGRKYLVALYIDKSERLCATMKIRDYLTSDSPYKEGEWVEGIIYSIHKDYGAFVAVDKKYDAMIENKDIVGVLEIGEPINFRISKVKKDGRLNLVLKNLSHIEINDNADILFNIIKDRGGFLDLNDKSDPDKIKDICGMSKSSFKKAVGRLLKNEKVKEAIHKHLDDKKLILGICNGFQALIKSGLIPYGRIKSLTENDLTLYRNDSYHHISTSAITRVANLNSPWTQDFEIGQLHEIMFSHGEGKLVGNNIEKFKDLCAFQYCDFEGNASSNGKFNPNGSLYAIEGMISEDGLVLGKMGHSERYGTGLYKNKTIKGIQNIFRNGVNYFKGEK